MALKKYVGYVKTNKVGSACEFEFEVDDEDLPDNPPIAKTTSTRSPARRFTGPA